MKGGRLFGFKFSLPLECSQRLPVTFCFVVYSNTGVDIRTRVLPLGHYYEFVLCRELRAEEMHDTDQAVGEPIRSEPLIAKHSARLGSHFPVSSP